MRIAFLLAFLVPAYPAAAVENDSLEIVRAGCRAFQAKLAADPRVESGVAQVPRDWSHPAAGDTLPVFWWKRAGADPFYPPLVFFHGGPASSSWALLEKWKTVIDQYPGDFVAFDHRGEGCSKTLPSNLEPAAYEVYRIRSLVRDVEFLRTNVFHYARWRVVGHSRGAALVHYYLEMAPDGIESAHAMGFSIMPDGAQGNYPMVRALGYYQTSQAYQDKYPDDAALLEKVRQTIRDENMCWTGVDAAQVCGPAVTDILGYNFVKNLTSWPTLHQKIAEMTDAAAIRATLAPYVPSDTYGHFNYLVATNGRDFGSPDRAQMKLLHDTRNPIYADPLIAELRYVYEAIVPTVRIDFSPSVDPLDYDLVIKHLDEHPDLKYFLYGGTVDPIAPLSMYQGEVRKLGPRVRFEVLPSGHDGWFHPKLLENVMRKTYGENPRSRAE